MVALVAGGGRDLLTDGFHLLSSSVAVAEAISLVGFVMAFFRNGLLNGPAGGVTFGRVCLSSSNEDEMEILDEVVEYEGAGIGGGDSERGVSFCFSS